MMTVSQAGAVNTLLNWIISRSGATGRVPDRQSALAAAELLARHANARLYAGVRPEELLGAWPTEVGEADGAARVQRAADLEALINRLTWALDDHPDTGAVDDHQQCTKVQEVGREVVSWLRQDLAETVEKIKAADDSSRNRPHVR